jgi:hypothetical protein
VKVLRLFVCCCGSQAEGEMCPECVEGVSERGGILVAACLTSDVRGCKRGMFRPVTTVAFRSARACFLAPTKFYEQKVDRTPA